MSQQSVYWSCPQCQRVLGTVVRGALYLDCTVTPVSPVVAIKAGRREMEVRCRCGGWRVWPRPYERAGAVQ